MTEVDLRHSLVPDEIIEQLTQSMPKHGPPIGEDNKVPAEDRELSRYDYMSFMKTFMGEDGQGETTNGRRDSSNGTIRH